VQYASEDGTLIPMTIIRRADMKYNADQATMLYGYGGFGVPIDPFYDPGFIFFVQNGGVIAVPGIRGGGENGEAWHQAGRTLNKINAINDFAYAAKYLIKNRITNANKIVARGSSNGALIISASINKYPDLFKAAVLEMGLYDMIRYNLFTTGYIASSEYGTSSNLEDFKNLISYSPIHNINSNVNYPSIYVITGDNDDRVPALHSYKYVAGLQSLSQQNNIILLEILKNAGHYGPQTYEDLLMNEARIYAYIFRELGIKIKLKN
ncbi:MAG: prolyl oligopeptidase family serine peptidase, partial [bacterium]